MNIVKISGLVKSFRQRRVLDGLSMSVNTGDIYGLLGPNGAGKTTTMRILIGLLGYKKGDVSVLGENPLMAGEKIRQKANMLPEDFSLYGWMSAIDYLNFFAGLYGVEKSRRELTKALNIVGLDNKDTIRPIRTFSRGMKQRLGLARAVINEPQLLFLDEPTSGLDPKGRKEIHNLLLELNKEKNTTIIISTHILDDVERLCRRIGILYKGRLQYEGGISAGTAGQKYRYRFKVANENFSFGGVKSSYIRLIGKENQWITCLIEGISPTEAIKMLIARGIYIIEAKSLANGIEELYLEHTI